MRRRTPQRVVQLSAKSSDGPTRGGLTPLAVAWLALAAVMTAGATYAALGRQAPPAGEPPLLSVPLDLAQVAGNTGAALPTGEASGGAAAEPSVSRPEQATTIDGERPAWRRFAALGQDTGGRPRVAIVMTGLGLSRHATEAAIEDLPSGITLSFTPYAEGLERWIAQARDKGHEVMLDLPMEPVTFPDDDPGPQALLTHLDAAQNGQRLSWVLGRGEGYVGVAAVMGSRFTVSETHLKPVLEAVKGRGLMFLDNRASEFSVATRLAKDLGLPHAANDRTLDDGHASHVAIDARLAQIERVALSDGAAVAMARPYPATIERLQDWARTLEARGFILVPITALAEARATP